MWLDFRTDEEGDGRAAARHGWGFREDGARSVVIHDRQGGAGGANGTVKQAALSPPRPPPAPNHILRCRRYPVGRTRVSP